MLVGEPGIGKTWIARQLADDARLLGVAVLSGCSFDGDWQPPYGPWVEALGEYARSQDVEVMRRQLGLGAAPLGQLVRDIRTNLPDTPPPYPLSPDEERFRLYDAVVQFLSAVSLETPLLLVLDDLHWADRDSLRLLRHLARFVGQSRIMILGAYRDADVELHRQETLDDVLAVLQRETDYLSIQIEGMGEDEVAEYLEMVAGQSLPRTVVTAIYAETNGNPFFVREVFRHLVEEGKILRRAGRWSTDLSLAELGIPPGIRQVLDRRISHLSVQTITLLRLAAGFSGGFDFDVLQALTGFSEETLLDGLDEALAAKLIHVKEGTPAVYDFVHAIVRHALYDQMNPDRRARLHRRIALSLEKVNAGKEMDHAAELAAQYHASARLPDASKGIAYALVAAERARDGYAYDQVVSFLRMARDLSSEDIAQEKAGILCKLAVAEAETLLLEEAKRTADEALTILSASGALPKVHVEFLAKIARLLKESGAAPDIWEPLVERGLALAGAEHDLHWARLMLLVDPVETVATGKINAGRWLGFDRLAVAIARASGNEDDYAHTLELFAPRTHEETEAILAVGRTWQRPTAIIRALDIAARDMLYRHSAFHVAGDLYQEFYAAAKRYGSILWQAESLAQLSAVWIGLGELDRARRTAEQALEMSARLGVAHGLHFIQSAIASVLAYYLDGFWPAIATQAALFAADPEGSRRPSGLAAASLAALAHCRAGNEGEALELLEALTPIVQRMDPTMYGHSAVVTLATSAIWYLKAREHAAAYRSLAIDLIGTGIGERFVGPYDLAVARMASLLGDLAEAREYFARARYLTEIRCLPHDRAIVDFDEAVALLDNREIGDPRVPALLESAHSAFEKLGMKGWAERILVFKRQSMLDPQVATIIPDERGHQDGLTPRELAVLRLIAGGKTNKEIAAELFLSRATVERHAANIYGKIGVRGRAEATAYALSRGLTQRLPQ